MRICYINDCTGFVNAAPCCLDCPEKETCPDRCSRKESTYCVGVMREADSGAKAEGVNGQEHYQDQQC